jgi:hypothetical protein
MKKPTPLEYVISETGIRHVPTDERFISFVGKPGDGRWQDGHSLKANDYNQDEVRSLGRKIWAEAVLARIKEPRIR